MKTVQMACVILIGGVIAAWNLWLILALHASAVLWIFGFGRAVTVRKTTRLDALALRTTGDLGAAMRFVHFEEKRNRNLFGATLKERVKALRVAAGKEAPKS